MQFIAEYGIEYGCQFVSPFFLNPLNCLYTKKSCDFFQSYEKSRAEQKEPVLFYADTQNAMGMLFDCTSDNISVHLQNIYDTDKLKKEATTEKVSVVRREGNRNVNRMHFGREETQMLI